MDLRQKKTIYYFGVALAIVVATAAFLRLSYEAKAASVGTLDIGAGDYSDSLVDKTWVGQTFVASGTSFRSIDLLTPLRSTSTSINMTLCHGQPLYFNKTSLEDCTGGEKVAGWTGLIPTTGNDYPGVYSFNYAFPNGYATVPEDYYYVIVDFISNQAATGYKSTSHYADGYLITASTTDEGTVDLWFKIYSDDGTVSSPDTEWTWNGWPTLEGQIKYQFNSKPNCLVGSACAIAYNWSENGLCYSGLACGSQAIGDLITMYWYRNGRMLDLAVGSTTVAWGTGTTSNGTVSVIAQNDVGQTQYCAVITDPHKVYTTKTICGITANWVTQDVLDIIYAKETCVGNAASSTVCDGDSGSWFDFGCGLKMAYNWAFTPSVSVCEDYALFLMDLDDQFPLNVYKEVQGKLDQINAATTSTTTTLVMPFFWAGTQQNINLVDAAAIRASDAGTLYDYAYDWIEYLMWGFVTLYFVGRVLRYRFSKDQ